MAMNWDWLIAALIILGLIFALWAKVSGQTVVELLSDLRDFIWGGVEDTQENIIYD